MSNVYGQRYQAFLSRLRKARGEAGLTQLEVAKRLRKPQSYVSKSESGERRVDIVEIEDFAAVYRRPVTYFLDRSKA